MYTTLKFNRIHILFFALALPTVLLLTLFLVGPQAASADAGDTAVSPESIASAVVSAVTSNVCFAQIEGTNSTYSSTDHSALQDAVDASSADDLIKVAGTCNGVQTVDGTDQVVYLDKSLTLQGGYTATGWVQGDYTTTLDAENAGRVVKVGNDISVTLDTLVIQNGISIEPITGVGGGVYVGSAHSVILTNTHLLSNTARTGGGAWLVADVALYNNVVRGNTATSGSGAGIYLFLDDEDNLYSYGNEIVENTAAGSGGGLRFYSDDTTLHLENDLIANNSSGSGEGGGGIYGTSFAELNLVNVEVRENRSESDGNGGGGGIYASNGTTMTIAQGTIVSNTAASGHGGGLYLNYIGTVDVIGDTEISYNEAITNGGGLAMWTYSGQTTRFEDVSFTGNTAVAGHGGGAHIYGASAGWIMTQTEVLSNRAALDGGGLYFDNGYVPDVSHTTFAYNSATNGGAFASTQNIYLKHSTLFANEASGSGGAVFGSAGTTYIENSTISQNNADYGGGIAMQSPSVVFIDYVSVVSNTAVISGGGVYAHSGVFRPETSIIAYSTLGDCQVENAGYFADDGYNLISDDSCALNSGTSLTSTNPLLGPLADNGGDTLTHDPISDASPVVDVIDSGDCFVTLDQRGLARPQGAACDVGAVEFVDTLAPSVAPSVDIDTADETAVTIGWIEDEANVRYDLYESTTPYTDHSLRESDVNSPLDVSLDGSSNHYFYIIQATGEDGSTADSNELGVFFFGLTAGD